MFVSLPTVNFGSFVRGRPHQPDSNHRLFAISSQRSPGALQRVGSLIPVDLLLGFELRTSRYCSQRLNPLRHSPQKPPVAASFSIPPKCIRKPLVAFIYRWQLNVQDSQCIGCINKISVQIQHKFPSNNRVVVNMLHLPAPFMNSLK